MHLQGGVASRRKPRERVEFNQEPCHIWRGLHLLCPPTCRCGNSLQGVEEKTEIIRGYGLNASGAELIATRDIANGDVVAVFGKTAMMWTSKEMHESQELVDETNDDPCDKFQYNVRGDNPGNKSLTLYIVPEKYAELVLSIKKSKSLAKALRHCSMQSGNGQFANHTCYTVHRNINIEIVTVQAAADNEYSNPITTVKLDVIVILRADWGIVMGEWIKTRYTDVQLNLDKKNCMRMLFSCRKVPATSNSTGAVPWRHTLGS